MCVNNLPKVVTGERLGRELNSRPLESQANAITITPPGHRPEADFKQSLSDVLLHGADRLSKLFGDRLTTQRLHVEIVGPCREYDESHDRHPTVRVL